MLKRLKIGVIFLNIYLIFKNFYEVELMNVLYT